MYPPGHHHLNNPPHRLIRARIDPQWVSRRQYSYSLLATFGAQICRSWNLADEHSLHSFWDTLDDDGERINLFQIASDHIQQNGRPYRIAVDTPYWLFKNLDEESVQAIRELSHRASNPNEKAILYRLMRFACHGIQVCLVFDGPGRPIKRGKQLTTTSHTLIGQRLLLLKEAAQKLGVLCWEAPAEAEAECANMLVRIAFSVDVVFDLVNHDFQVLLADQVSDSAWALLTLSGPKTVTSFYSAARRSFASITKSPDRKTTSWLDYTECQPSKRSSE